MSNAQNGARIKCWAGPDVGGGIVKNITFEHFVESNVDNPLIVDQVSYASFAALSTKKKTKSVQNAFSSDAAISTMISAT